MQIHELNNFSGTLGSGAYLAIDDGNDTGKISSQGLLAATEARIDNIIAGPAPSAEEIVDARLGDDGVTYPSLGDAIRDQFSDVKSEISEIDSTVNGEIEAISSGTDNTGYYSISSGNINYNSDGSSHSYVIDLSAYIGKTVHVVFSTTNTTSTRATVLGNSSLHYGSSADYIYERNMTADGFDVVPSDSYHILYVSYSSGGSNLSVSSRGASLANKIINDEVAFISPTGNDANDGTLVSPFLTVNRALEKGASKILVLDGKYTSQQINFTKAKRKTITIASFTDNAHPIFYAPEYLLCSSETKLSGYNNIYYYDGNYNFTSSIVWIFQEGVEDTATQIPTDEIHPLQRGKSYRCDDTKIEKCASASLSDALTEIDASDTYKFFYDSQNHRLYFSRPTTVSASNPICTSFGYRFLTNADRSITVNLIGIEAKYYRINVDNTTNSYIKDCKASNVEGYGAFTYDCTLGATFERCEASRCFNSSNGDGFNGHGTTNGEDFPKQITATLIECWSHDNQDDGYSDHERSETTIIGGLYEYNGKAGITPSYGSHCTCHDVLSRGNNNGFYYTGTKLDEGNCGQLVCYNCIAENNKRNGLKTGFLVDGNGNKMILYNCKSINNRKGFDTSSQANITLYDCGASGNEITKDGNVTAINTTLVS